VLAILAISIPEFYFEGAAFFLDARPLHRNQNEEKQEPPGMAEKHKYPGDEDRIE